MRHPVVLMDQLVATCAYHHQVLDQRVPPARSIPQVMDSDWPFRAAQFAFTAVPLECLTPKAFPVAGFQIVLVRIDGRTWTVYWLVAHYTESIASFTPLLKALPLESRGVFCFLILMFRTILLYALLASLPLAVAALAYWWAK